MTLSPFEFSVLCLAVYRAARIVSTDSISEGLRDRLSDWAEGDGWRQWLADLIECPFCASWHLSIIGYVVLVCVLGRWGDAPLLAHAVECWGVMGASAILTALDGKLTE